MSGSRFRTLSLGCIIAVGFLHSCSTYYAISGLEGQGYERVEEMIRAEASNDASSRVEHPVKRENFQEPIKDQTPEKEAEQTAPLSWFRAFQSFKKKKEYEVIRVKTDSKGNVFLTGQFWGAITIGGSTLKPIGLPKNTSCKVDTDCNFKGSTCGKGHCLYPSHFSDIFVMKLSQSGHILWSHVMGGKEAERVSDLAIGSDGACYITGNFFRAAKFGSFTVTSQASKASRENDMFVVKIGATGKVMWVQTAGDLLSNSTGVALTVSPENTVILVTSVVGASVFGSTVINASLDYRTGVGLVLSFIDPKGKFIKSSLIGGSKTRYELQVMNIHIGPDNKLHLWLRAARNSFTLLGKKFSGTTLLQSIFVRFSNSLKLLKSQTVQGNHRFFDSALDKQGNLYVAGRYLSSLSLGTRTLTGISGRGMLLVKLSPTYTWEWFLIGKKDSTSVLYGVDVTQQGDIYAVGSLSGSIEFKSLSFVTPKKGDGTSNRDALSLRISQDGKVITGLSFGSTGPDQGYYVGVDHANPGFFFLFGGFGRGATFPGIETPWSGSSSQIISHLTMK